MDDQITVVGKLSAFVGVVTNKLLIPSGAEITSNAILVGDNSRLYTC